MNDQIISICGDLCSECPRYLATLKKDMAALEKIAELWYRLEFRNNIVSTEEIKCNGCNKEKFCSHGLNNCEHLKNKVNCGECDKFPCKKINKVFEKTDVVKKICIEKCTNNEYMELSRAFLLKREILTEINYYNKKSHE